MDETSENVYALISKHAKIEYRNVYDNLKIAEAAYLDNLISEIENEFSVTFSEDDVYSVQTVFDLIETLTEKLAENIANEEEVESDRTQAQIESED